MNKLLVVLIVTGLLLTACGGTAVPQEQGGTATPRAYQFSDIVVKIGAELG